MSLDNETKLYGFTAVPANEDAIEPETKTPATVTMAELRVPTTALAQRVSAYVKSKLSADTYRHSLRVYSYGLAIARQCFPQFEIEPNSPLEETWFLTAMLHDIGTSDEFLTTTKLSFEFWGGYHALDLLQNPSVTGHDDGVAPRAQAESVAEAIIRHQDIQDKGNISLMTRLIHLGTLLDNIGAGAKLVSKDTIENVNKEYPRSGWSGCFKNTVEKEKLHKPYAMVSRIEGFEDAIDRNGKELMADFD